MSTPDHILSKIKHPLNLTSSPEPHEATAAQSMVDRLVAKYNVTQEELDGLAEKKPLYGENDKLFSTIGLVSWKQRLATAISKQLYCHIVQEELVPVEGLHHYSYFVYGDVEDTVNVKFAFHSFVKRIEELIDIKCLGRGPIYSSSYSEGLVEAISNNIYWEGINIPEIKSRKKPDVSDQKNELNSTAPAIVVHKEEKEKPLEQTINVNSQALIKDVQAYFKGLTDGSHFSLNEILELEAENERAKEFQGAKENSGTI